VPGGRWGVFSMRYRFFSLGFGEFKKSTTHRVCLASERFVEGCSAAMGEL
jgi:hypothetical protein